MILLHLKAKEFHYPEAKHLWDQVKRIKALEDIQVYLRHSTELF